MTPPWQLLLESTLARSVSGGGGGDDAMGGALWGNMSGGARSGPPVSSDVVFRCCRRLTAIMTVVGDKVETSEGIATLPQKVSRKKY